MQSALETFLSGMALAYMLTFARIGTAAMIMPGIGDSFVPERIRLHLSLGLSLVMFPIVWQYLPDPAPAGVSLMALVAMEVIIGLMIGTVARIFMTALDTAGMAISMQSGLANAQVFNPSLAQQGSIIGAFLSVTGVVLLFSLNMHHLLIMGVVDSYNKFPMGELPDTGGMAEVIAMSVAAAFSIGMQLAAPFLVMTLLMYVGMGVLSRLMPQVQVFLLVIPLQILLSVMLLGIVMLTLFYHWAGWFEESFVFFISMGQ
ncbi:MAG: flagellar biosynthetic protein FliR [Alphaproteobacteria bacterium]|nr:flagellar biosynthetic protein FliR [Alphaproteobacteria bacterium]